MQRSFFITAVTLFLLSGYLYLGFRLASGSPLEALVWISVACPFLLIWSLPMIVWRSGRAERSRLGEIVLHAAYASMGILTYLFVFTVVRDLIHLAASLTQTPALEGIAVHFGPREVFVCTVAAVLLGTANAYFGPRVKRVTVKMDGLPSSLDELTIVQISDLHIGATIRRRYVERVVKLANGLSPDFIVLTGDIGDGAVGELANEIEPMNGLRAQAGVYYVPGNHEYYWQVDQWIDVMKKAGANVLLNQGKIVSHRGEKILIGGVTDPAASQIGRGEAPQVSKAIVGADGAGLKILLSHRPGIAEEAAAAGFDLQLSGHTHGGQFFPWTIVVRFAHKFFAGLGRSGKMWVYVNSGTGSWGPLIRLGTSPELTLIELKQIQ